MQNSFAVLIAALAGATLVVPADQRERLPSSVQQGTAAVSGTVIEDATGVAVPNAIVEVSVTDSDAERESVDRRQLTDQQGRFAIADLPISPAIRVRARKAGYLDGTYANDAGASQTSFNAEREQWLANAVLRLKRPASISGIVRDEAGAPVVDVWVRLFRSIEVSGAERLVAGTLALTDDNGMYRFAGLAPGDYYPQVPSVAAASGLSSRITDANLVISRHFAVPPPPSQGQAFVYPSTFAPSSLTPSPSDAVRVDSGEEKTGIDIQIVPRPAHRVRGSVSGPPESWAGLLLRLVPSAGQTRIVNDAIATTTVAPDGTFDFRWVPEGQYEVQADPAIWDLRDKVDGQAFREFEFGRSTLTPDLDVTEIDLATNAGLKLVMTSAKSAPQSWVRQPATVGGSDLDLLISTHPAGRMQGRVIKEIDRRMQTPQAEPVAGLFLDPVGPALASPRTNQPADDTSPQFTIAGILPGRYVLRASHGWLIKAVSWRGRDYLETPFDAADGTDVTGVTVTVTNAAARISGVVADANGRPTPRASILVFPADSNAWSERGLSALRMRRVAAGHDGQYHVDGLPAGGYRVIALEASRPLSGVTPELLQTLAPLATSISLNWGAGSTANLNIQSWHP